MVTPPPTSRDVFEAVADPTRRLILDLLAQGERAVMDIVGRFDITQPSISEHLRILRDAGLVVVRPMGRRRIYQLNVAPMRELAEWLGTYVFLIGDRLVSRPMDRNRTVGSRPAMSPQTLYSQMSMEID